MTRTKVLTLSDDELVLKLARFSRVNIEILRAKFGGLYGNKDLSGYCGVASIHMRNICKLAGVYIDVVYGKYNSKNYNSGHCWNEYNSQVIDITGTQFGVDIVVPVNVTTVKDVRYIREQRNVDVENYVNMWPPEQRYSTYRHILNEIAIKTGQEILRTRKMVS